MPGFAQGFEGYVKADLVPVLEAIGDGLGNAGDAYRHAIDEMLLHPFGQSCTGESNNPHRWIVDSGGQCFVVDGEPDFKRRLSSNFMEAQCGEQADNTLRNPQRHFGKGAVFGDWPPRQAIDTTPNPLKLTVTNHPRQADARNPCYSQIVRSDQATGFGQVEQLAGVGFRDCQYVPLLR